LKNVDLVICLSSIPYCGMQPTRRDLAHRAL
jgi:hypothetical protein